MFKRTALTLLIFIGLSGCAQASPTRNASTVSESAEASVAEERCIDGVAVVGDSITSWDPPYSGTADQSWVTTAVASGMMLNGGWAYPGATLGEMSASVQPSTGTCFLVVMGGTNDIVQNVTVDERLANLDSIVATVDAEQLVVSAVAPLALDPAGALEWNLTLASYASSRGAVFIDPWEELRTDEGGWVSGASLRDGVHPSPATAAFVGRRISAHLERLAVVLNAEPGDYPTAV